MRFYQLSSRSTNRFTRSTDSDIDPVIVPQLRQPFEMLDKTVAIVLAISTLGKTVTCMDRANQQGLISGWVTAWGGNGSMALYDQYDEISFLGALTDPDGGVNMTAYGDPPTASTFTPENMTNIEPLLSVGGWAGSQFVCPMFPLSAGPNEQELILCTSVLEARSR